MTGFSVSQQQTNLNVLGVDVGFRPGADMERAQIAAKFVEERFAEQKARSLGGQSKDILLTFVVLGLADELLQMKKIQEQTQVCLENLIAKIEKSF